MSEKNKYERQVHTRHLEYNLFLSQYNRTRRSSDRARLLLGSCCYELLQDCSFFWSRHHTLYYTSSRTSWGRIVENLASDVPFVVVVVIINAMSAKEKQLRVCTIAGAYTHCLLIYLLGICSFCNATELDDPPISRRIPRARFPELPASTVDLNCYVYIWCVESLFHGHLDTNSSVKRCKFSKFLLSNPSPLYLLENNLQNNLQTL